MFDAFLAMAPSLVDVDIEFESAGGQWGEWVIVPQAAEFSHIVARFGIPPLLESWLLTDSGIDQDRVGLVEQQLLSSISVFHHDNRLTRLRYEKVQPLQPVQELLGDGISALRQDRIREDLAYDAQSSEEQEAVDLPGLVYAEPSMLEVQGWTLEALQELLRRLGIRGQLWQREVIVMAALASEGLISRKRIFEIARDRGEAVLKRLGQKLNSITRELQKEEILGHRVQPALTHLDADGMQGRMVYYAVPPEFRDLIAQVDHRALG